MTETTTITMTKRWREYFLNRDEGLGTTYERFILHRHFGRLKARYSVRSILEAPSFGMTGISGINSLWWAWQGSQVTIVDQDPQRLDAAREVWKEMGLAADFVYQAPASAVLPFADRSFDLVWNFAALWHVEDGEAYLRELARIARRTLFLCVPNQHNVCWVLRPHSAGNYHLNNISPEWMISSMAKCGWQLVETGFLDVPPWPDIAMRKEDMLKGIGLGWLGKLMTSEKGEGVCILDYFSGKAPDMERRIMKYGFLERFPRWFQNLWAHHRFQVFERA